MRGEGDSGKLKSIAGRLHTQLKVKYTMTTVFDERSSFKRHTTPDRSVKVWVPFKATQQVEQAFLDGLHLNVSVPNAEASELEEKLMRRSHRIHAGPSAQKLGRLCFSSHSSSFCSYGR